MISRPSACATQPATPMIGIQPVPGPLGLDAPDAAKLRIDLLGGLFADMAGVQKHQIGVFDRVGSGIAIRRKRIGHALRIVDIHLAAIGLDEDFFGRADCFGWRANAALDRVFDFHAAASSPFRRQKTGDSALITGPIQFGGPKVFRRSGRTFRYCRRAIGSARLARVAERRLHHRLDLRFDQPRRLLAVRPGRKLDRFAEMQFHVESAF